MAWAKHPNTEVPVAIAEIVEGMLSPLRFSDYAYLRNAIIVLMFGFGFAADAIFTDETMQKLYLIRKIKSD